jgi:formate dehydrogenase subunit beta
MRAGFRVEQGDGQASLQQALRGFLKRLLEAGVVEALLVPLRTPSGSVTPALVVDPQLLDQADLLAPVLPVNGAALASQLSVRTPGAVIGAVLRSCELRALLELVKLKQADLQDLILIALDCAGTTRVQSFLKGDKGDGWDKYKALCASPETPDPDLRLACQICERPVFSGAQISIELFGSDPGKEIRISLTAEIGEKLRGPGSLIQFFEESGSPDPDGRAEILDRLAAARMQRRDAEFAEIRARLEGGEGLPGVFAACLNCHNCMRQCPICYCKTCVFDSPVFDHEPVKYINWASQKGACRLPADTLLFHLTRMNHMAVSCVGCGMCTQACPVDLPVGLVFRAVGQRLQDTFDYEPGRSRDEPLPLVTFKVDEWTEIGE